MVGTRLSKTETFVVCSRVLNEGWLSTIVESQNMVGELPTPVYLGIGKVNNSCLLRERGWVNNSRV